MRRTLALAGAAVLGVTGLAGPAAADPGVLAGIVVINEVALDLDSASVNHDFTDAFIELTNIGDQDLDVSTWQVLGCNSTESLQLIATIPNSTSPIPPNGHLLIGSVDFDSGTGPSADVVVSVAAFDHLEQPDSAVVLRNGLTTMDDIKWGEPHPDCAAFTDANAVPTDAFAIHRNSPDWDQTTPTPTNLAGETS